MIKKYTSMSSVFDLSNRREKLIHLATELEKD
jgi:hypothetical protein